MRFVGNLILSTRCKFYFDDITVTSFINTRYCDVVDQERPGCRLVSTTDATMAAVDSLMWFDRRMMG